MFRRLYWGLYRMNVEKNKMGHSSLFPHLLRSFEDGERWETKASKMFYLSDWCQIVIHCSYENKIPY